ncbi:hypothetical protein [Enterococcus faecalis]|uniref:hypothetical protein n=1 Tax=Enterococcus faecalis TaxID=1351 RepID=UPI0022F3AF1B|nr:hypothetical protein [Enterococcus faecalis]WBY27875.1 hypothetical protein PE069_14035 [Enterococcus faecalis]
MNQKKKLGFFFGAGAELGYGLPSGGRFALEIFKGSKEEDREAFRQRLTKVDLQSQIATQWLPENFQSKRISIFGKGNFEEIISSSLEHRRKSTLEYLENFDSNIVKILENWDIDESTLRKNFYQEIEIEIGDKLYSQEIALNKKLADQVSLFGSEYFSAFLKLLELKPNSDLRRIIVAFLELLLGALGQNLVSQLNEELFEKAPTTVNIFDDISGIFNINYSSVGQVGMEIVIEQTREQVDKNTDINKVFIELGKTMLEQIYCQTLDYQSLIDSHFRYLYNPKSQWAKFTKIAVFLYTVQRYIKNPNKIDKNKIKNGPGFYHDLIEIQNDFDLHAVGTTNYNNLIGDVFWKNKIKDVSIYHLNGSVQDYYDPYKNRIVSDLSKIKSSEQIVVPFIFTQSGVKPLTSITMSKRYVELYEKFKECDSIAIIGYGFNGDDGHINGMFRSLIEEENKDIHIFHYASEKINHSNLHRMYQNKLRLNSKQHLYVHLIDDRRFSEEEYWYKSL